MKTTSRLITIAGVLVLSVVLLSFMISGLNSSNTNNSLGYTHSWTKAICNETACQDYVIYCYEDELLSQTPITGAVMRVSPGWEDPRNETMRERVCDLD